MLRSEGETLRRFDQSGGSGARCEASQGLDPSGGQIDASLTRRAFVGALTEWAQMHDYHTPFANGPPAKGQPCAKVVNEFAASECLERGKMFPRKLIQPGQEEVAEDPRRKDLYRLWLSRNCSSINNFASAVLLASLRNMEFQAMTTKFGVVECMTKYMTKSGQGSLLHVMEHGFSRCVEQARGCGLACGCEGDVGRGRGWVDGWGRRGRCREVSGGRWQWW